MRRMLFALVAVTLAIPMLATARPSSPPRASCTEIGTGGNDILSGTDHKDVICALPGNDYAHGANGPDIVFGDSGRDSLIAGRGRDVLKGVGGNDRLFAVDGRGDDVLKGGTGRDRCYGDEGDTFRGCEGTPTGPSLELVNQLTSSFLGALRLADKLISATPTPAPIPSPPPGTTVTTTITVVVTVPPLPFPPCSPPPFVIVPPCVVQQL